MVCGNYQQPLVHCITLFMYILHWYTLYFIFKPSYIHQSMMVGAFVSIRYILTYLPPRPSSTRKQKSIEPAPQRQQLGSVVENHSTAMQNPAFYGSWPLNLNQYAWSPEAIQQYQNMLLTDPTLQQQMHQSQTHQPQHTPPAMSPATTATSIPPPPPPPPPPSLSPPSTPVTSSFPNPSPAYSQSTPHPTNLPHRTPSTAPTPTTWKPDSQHYDSNPLHGNPLFRQIQPTAWSRAVWILSFYQLPPCSAKAKRSMRWDC